MIITTKAESRAHSHKGLVEVPISVIIATRNRPEKLAHCLQALKANSISNFKLIIIDQGDTYETNVQKQLNLFRHWSYIQVQYRGKSRGLNHGLNINIAPIIAFTDDDCIPDGKWLANILATFSKYPQISGVFGRTLPYESSRHNKDLVCPSAFDKTQSRLINKPCRHWKYIGLGNNMAFRRDVFKKLGGFKEWLGPGSIGSGAEDAEIALRTLIAGKKLFFNPEILIYHDRWLTQREYQKQILSYACGESACYGHFALMGHAFAKKVVKESLYDTRSDIKRIIVAFIYFRPYGFSLFFWSVGKALFRLRGGIAAYYFTTLSSLTRNSRQRKKQ